MKKDAIFNAIFKEYVEDYSAEMNLAERTIRGKRDTLKRFIKYLGDKPFTLKNCRDWSHYLRKKGLKPRSVKHELRILKATVNFLYKRGFIETNFASDISYPRVPKELYNIVPAHVVEKVIISGTEEGEGDNIRSKTIKKEMRQALRFILRTGLRIGEVMGLKSSNINLKAGTFNIKSKGGNIHVLPLPKDMESELRERLGGENVFKVTRETMNRSLRRGSEVVGVQPYLTCHDLRHVFCTCLLKRGVSMPIVTRLMRHASVTLTDAVYSHYVVSDLSHALNSRHPLIIGGVGIDGLFDIVQKAIEDTGVQNDPRLQLRSSRSSDGLTINIFPVKQN